MTAPFFLVFPMASLNTLSAAVDTAITSLVTAVTNFQTEVNVRDVAYRASNHGKPSQLHEDFSRYVIAAVASKPILATVLHLPPQNPTVTVAGVGLPD